MANLYFISDTHFGHANMLKFLREDGTPLRSFESVQEMDERIVDRWNSVVRPQDHVYHLGDVAMKQSEIATVGRCNGHKRLVRGNHDIYKTKKYLEYFDEIYGIRVLDNILFTHIPVHPESLGRFKANAHGHIHAQKSPEGKYINLSVEAINYTPVALEDLKKQIEKQWPS